MNSRVASPALCRALLGVSAFGLLAAPAFAQSADRPTVAINETKIVIRADLDPNALPPAGILDSGINGIGQMTVRGNPASTSMNLCTGTLINPRTVLFAAHCVNTRPADAYGPNGVADGLQPNGTPIAFGFNADNLPAVRQWLGLASAPGAGDADPSLTGRTNVARALYAVEQVWYDPRSKLPTSCTGPTSCFLQADIAIATLDTPAFDIPSWAMLFSPLDGPTHAVVSGYGAAGRATDAAIGIDFRRRAAENMLSVLGSFNDRNRQIFGTANSIDSNLYMLSFNDPDPAYNPAAGKFDFGIFGGTALPREGSTAGGDSGSALIVDEAYDRKVVVGVLSGGSRFFAAQTGHAYGTHDFFQPLHLYWDQIVANNPYVYAGNKAGVRNWEDATAWVQLMDPNYFVDVNGELVNGLPDTAAQGLAGGGAKFGTVCFLTNCTTLAGTQAAGDGTPVFIEGGPGSTNFVPNNRAANPKAGVRARYYDVTLAAQGAMTLASQATVDRMTVDGPVRFGVTATGRLNVLGEYNQLAGWTHVDGMLTSGRDMLFASGLLSGSGTLKAPFVTVGATAVAPGGADRIATLTVDGNMILTSGSALFIDAARGGADKLSVTGILSLSGEQGAASLVFNKPEGGPAPRHGETHVIAEAATLQGEFGKVFSFQGVLRPKLTYADNKVTAELRAGSLVEILDGQNATALAFAKALDTLRDGNYDRLAGLYGQIDLMDGRTLSTTLGALSPAGIAGSAVSLQDRQSRLLTAAVSDRLSLLGQPGRSGTLSITGSATTLSGLASGQLGAPAAGNAAAFGLAPAGQARAVLPEGVSGFVSSGRSGGGSVTPGNRGQFGGQQSWQMSAGLEVAVSDRTSLGTAFGVARGFAQPGGAVGRADSDMTQAAIYGAHQFGGGLYGGFLAAAETSRTGLERTGAVAGAGQALFGAARASRYAVSAEAGWNLAVAKGLTLTPRASLGYSAYDLAGFNERGGQAALRVDGLRLERIEARLGARFAGQAAIGGGWSFVPQIQADYVRGLSASDAGLNVRFAGAPDLAFVLPFANGDRNWSEVRGGLTLTNGRLSFGAGLETSVGRAGFEDNRAVADVSFRF